MRFTVPQFIDYEAKMLGPLTFNQFLVVAGAGVICFFLYFIVPSFKLFLGACIILVGGSFALVSVRIGGRSLPLALGNFLKFTLMPKMYIWSRREEEAVVFEKEETLKKEGSSETNESNQLNRPTTPAKTR